MERIRQENRVKITETANCVPPLSEEEAKELQIRINVNWSKMVILLSHARRQYLTAFLSNQYFFKVSLPFAPAEHQSEWESYIAQGDQQAAARLAELLRASPFALVECGDARCRPDDLAR